MESPDVPTQLLALREFTRQQGVLHEAQLLQVRMWAGLVFGKKWDAEVDPDARTITIKLPRKKTALKDRDFDEACMWIARAVTWLLGEEWSFLVEVRGNLVFESVSNAGKDERKPGTTSPESPGTPDDG